MLLTYPFSSPEVSLPEQPTMFRFLSSDRFRAQTFQDRRSAPALPAKTDVRSASGLAYPFNSRQTSDGQGWLLRRPTSTPHVRPSNQQRRGAVFSSFDIPHLNLNLASELPCDKGKTGRKKGEKMAGFLRARQAGIQNDLSAGIVPGMFNPDELVRYGIGSQIW
jgi:hypothetical protein